MATKKKLLQAAAGTAAASGGAGGLNVEQVFSTYLYDGNGSSQVIENGINLGQSNSGGSAYFSKGVLNIADDASFQFGSGDWTVETFFYAQASTHEDGTNQNPVFISWGDDANNRWDMGWQDPNNPRVFVKIGGTNYDIYGGATHAITNYVGQWVHFAATRNGSTLRFFINGSQVASGSISGNMPDPNTGGVYIGARSYATTSAYNDTNTGFISNMRVVKGTALYTSSFTAPTSALTAVSGTSLLAFTGDEPLNDTSSNAHTITQAGNATDAVAKTFGPFDAADAGEGGLVWFKNRISATNPNQLYDTERGVTKRLKSDSTDPEQTASTGLLSFNSSGFSIGSASTINSNGEGIASWTFRKAPKFFDVVTYTGDGTSNRQINHNLGCDVGMLVVKRTDGSNPWAVYHRGSDATAPEDKELKLNQTDKAINGYTTWARTAPTTTDFTVGSEGKVNENGWTYVAYLFAHNDGDGDFGPTGDQDVIRCGSYTGNGLSTGPEIDLGFEPQWVMIKRTDAADAWNMWDIMRGWQNGSNDSRLRPDDSSAESTNAFTFGHPTATGFKIDGTSGAYNQSSGTYIYIAIRRGPMAVPTDATDVFAQDNKDGADQFDSGWPVDFTIQKNDVQTATADWIASARLQGNYFLRTHSTDIESANNMRWDTQDGLGYGANINDQDDWAWMWKRAPNFFDVVAYTGNGTAGRTVSHNLGVAPEMMWVKKRNASGSIWAVFHKDIGATKFLRLNTSDGEATLTALWNDTAPTSDVFTVGTGGSVNDSGDTFIAYLFASLDGVSKVGSYTGNGTSQNIDCGFSSGARFVLIKIASGGGNWNLWDSERGIVAGNDPYLRLNTTDAEVTGFDLIDPYSSGFTVSANAVNASSQTFIFYAIA